MVDLPLSELVWVEVEHVLRVADVIEVLGLYGEREIVFDHGGRLETRVLCLRVRVRVPRFLL